MVWAAHDTHPILYQIYVANPVTQAVLLLQRLFWYPLIEDPKRAAAAVPARPLGARPDHAGRSASVLLWLAQRFFSRVEGKFPERL